MCVCVWWRSEDNLGCQPSLSALFETGLFVVFHCIHKTRLSMSVLVRVSTAVKRHHGHGNSYKRKHLIGAGLQFTGLAQYHPDGKHGSLQADMLLERQLR